MGDELIRLCGRSRIASPSLASFNRTSVRILELDNSSALRAGNWCCHSARFNCPSFNHQSIRPAVAQQLSTTSNVTRPRFSFWWSCSLSMFSSCVAPSSKSCHQIHFCHMASVPMQRTANQTRRLSSGTSAMTVYTQHPLASKVAEASQSEACRCCIWNCSLSVRSRRQHVSQRMDTRLARETPTNWSSSRTGTIRTFLDSTSSMRAFKCLECEVVHLGLPEEEG